METIKQEVICRMGDDSDVEIKRLIEPDVSYPFTVAYDLNGRPYLAIASKPSMLLEDMKRVANLGLRVPTAAWDKVFALVHGEPTTAPSVQLPSVPQTIPSAHGGKPIPVVRSHAAIAAAKKAANTPKQVAGAITSKTYVLVGKREDSGEIKVVADWPIVPTLAQIEEAKKGLKYKYTQFALTSVQNLWDA